MTYDSSKKFDLTGKTAFITAGGTGLGYSMTRALAGAGAKVMIASRRESVLENASKKIVEEIPGAEIVFHTIDLNDRTSVAEVAQHANSTLGGVDIFVGNAGMEFHETVDEFSESGCDQMLQVNLVSNLSLMREFLPHMRANRWGRIIFSSSVMTYLASVRDAFSVYAASKGALSSYTRSAAAEVGHDGITVNSLIIGAFNTELMQEVMASGNEDAMSIINSIRSMTSLGRVGECEDIEGVVQLLASNAGAYITGSNLVIDGGMTNMLHPNLPPEI